MPSDKGQQSRHNGYAATHGNHEHKRTNKRRRGRALETHMGLSPVGRPPEAGCGRQRNAMAPHGAKRV